MWRSPDVAGDENPFYLLRQVRISTLPLLRKN